MASTGRFLTEAAIDALDHVEVVAGGASHAVVAARVGLDGDRRSVDGQPELTAIPDGNLSVRSTLEKSEAPSAVGRLLAWCFPVS
jgi:hypothetical protein